MSLRPTDAWVRILLVPVVVFVSQASSTAYLADFWHHLARGRCIVTEGKLLDHDIFTYTVPDETFQDVNWLTQVIYFVLYEQGGLALEQTVNALLLAVTFGWVVLLCRRLSGSLVAALAVGIAVFLGLWQVLTIRPQTFSLLLFVALFDALERSERNVWWLVAPPIFLALWANLHGAFPAGLMLTGCFFATAFVQAWRMPRASAPSASGRWQWTWQLAACLAACVLATLVNPYGWHIYAYVGQTSNRAAQRRIDEWVPPDFTQMIGVAFFVSLLALPVLIVLAWRSGWRPAVRDIVLMMCFLPLAVRSVRMVAWWLLAMAPVASILLAWLVAAHRRRQAGGSPVAGVPDNVPTVGAALSCAGLLLVAVFSLPGLQAYNPLLAFRPKERVEGDLNAVIARLKGEIGTGHVFTRFEWGEYFTWAGYPDFKIFMDGRIEIYPDEVWNEYETVTVGRGGWETILDKYKVAALVLDAEYHARTGLLVQVDGSPAWRRVDQVRGAILYIRK